MYAATNLDHVPHHIDLPDFGRRLWGSRQRIAPLSDADVKAIEAEGWRVKIDEIPAAPAKPPRERVQKPAKPEPKKKASVKPAAE